MSFKKSSSERLDISDMARPKHYAIHFDVQHGKRLIILLREGDAAGAYLEHDNKEESITLLRSVFGVKDKHVRIVVDRAYELGMVDLKAENFGPEAEAVRATWRATKLLGILDKYKVSNWMKKDTVRSLVTEIEIVGSVMDA